MRDRGDEAIRLLEGVLGHVRGVVGDGAYRAMLHYGAVEEGRRLVDGAEFRDALERLDSVLGHRSEVVRDDGALVVVRVSESVLVESEDRVLAPVVTGLIEGALSAARRARYSGRVLEWSARKDALIEFSRAE